MNPNIGEMRIGDWALDASTGELARGSDRRQLAPIEVAVLLHMAEVAPHPVSVRELLDRNWPGVLVVDNVVHRVVARLRKAFGDDSPKTSVIETLPRRGYRLRTVVSEDVPYHSVAVLPFDDLSPDRDQSWLVDGFVDELIESLGRIRPLRVPRRASTAIAKKRSVDIQTIGHQLDVQTVVTGSVRRAGDRISIACAGAKEPVYLYLERLMQQTVAVENRDREAFRKATFLAQMLNVDIEFAPYRQESRFEVLIEQLRERIANSAGKSGYSI